VAQTTITRPPSRREQPADQPPTAGQTPPPAQRLRLRRRPALVAGSVAAISGGALLSVWAYTSTNSTVDVLAARHTVAQGQVIERADLVTAQLNVDPAVDVIPADKASDVIGRRAAMSIPAGGVLTREQVTAALIPPAGQSVVGLSLAPGMMPAGQLRPGDTVRVVSTPGEQGTVPEGEPPSLTATVIDVRGTGDGSGTTVVNVQVDDADAPLLAARASTGLVAVVLDSRER